MRNIILVDCDNTLTDAYWRDEMVGVAPWDEYHVKSIDDLPAPDFVPFIVHYANNLHYDLIGITARPEKWRNLTMRWLAVNGIRLDDLWMRKDGDFRPAPDIKLSLCEEKLGEGWRERISLIIDDNDRVIEAFKGENITCLQIFNRRRL